MHFQAMGPVSNIRGLRILSFEFGASIIAHEASVRAAEKCCPIEIA